MKLSKEDVLELEDQVNTMKKDWDNFSEILLLLNLEAFTNGGSINMMVEMIDEKFKALSQIEKKKHLKRILNVKPMLGYKEEE